MWIQSYGNIVFVICIFPKSSHIYIYIYASYLSLKGGILYKISDNDCF